MAIWRKNKSKKSIKIEPKKQKPLKGIELPDPHHKEDKSSFAMSLLFGGSDYTPTFSRVTEPATEAVAKEIIRIDWEIQNKLGIQSATELDTNPQLNIQYQRLVANSNIPKLLFTPDVQSYLGDKNHHSINNALQNMYAPDRLREDYYQV